MLDGPATGLWIADLIGEFVSPLCFGGEERGVFGGEDDGDLDDFEGESFFGDFGLRVFLLPKVDVVGLS